jgi:hypothetical protein
LGLGLALGLGLELGLGLALGTGKIYGEGYGRGSGTVLLLRLGSKTNVGLILRRKVRARVNQSDFSVFLPLTFVLRVPPFEG